jgi:hypothetical protein
MRDYKGEDGIDQLRRYMRGAIDAPNWWEVLCDRGMALVAIALGRIASENSAQRGLCLELLSIIAARGDLHASASAQLELKQLREGSFQ